MYLKSKRFANTALKCTQILSSVLFKLFANAGFKNIKSRREIKCHYVASFSTIARSHVTFSAASLLTQLRFLILRNGSTQYNLHFLNRPIFTTLFHMDIFSTDWIEFKKNSRNCLLGNGKHFICKGKKSRHIIDDDNCSVFCQIFIIGCPLKKSM